MRPALIVLLLVSIIPVFSKAQDSDSLLQSFRSEELSDSLRFDAIHKLTWSVIFSDMDKAKAYAGMHTELANQTQNEKQRARALNNLGVAHAVRADYETAQKYYEDGLAIREKIGDKPGMAATFNNLGILFKEQNALPKALDYFLRSLEIHEESGDKKNQSSSLNNIGTIYFEQEDYDKAGEYFSKSYEIGKETNNKANTANALLNLGLIEQEEDDHQLALEHFTEALKTYHEINELRSVSKSHYNIGRTFISLHSDSLLSEEAYLDSAMYHYRIGLEFARSIDSKFEEANALNGIGKVLLADDQPSEALKYFTDAHLIAASSDLARVEAEALDGKYQCYKKLGNSGQALKAYERYIAIRDSLDSKDIQKKLIRSQLNAEYEKERLAAEQDRLAERKEQEKREALNEKERQKQRLVIYAVTGGFILIAIFALFLFNRFRVIKRQKELIEDQKVLVETQRDITNQQKIKLEDINKELTDSISYAQKIQRAVLRSSEIIESGTNSYFNFYKPKDIVSGDFYWGLRKGDYLYIAVVDCTGHGVPGAFMSLLGISFLNQITSGNEVMDTHTILEELRKRVIRQLGQKGAHGESRDGMDAVLIRLDYSRKENITMQYSGANNPVFMVRSKSAQENNSNPEADKVFEKEKCTLFEFKGDKMPIGFHYRMEPFTSKSVALQSGDSVYLTSDGYPDQFGGPRNKRFMMRNFKELLCEMEGDDFVQRQEKLEAVFYDHMGDLDQLDDVCVLGISV